MTGLNPKIVGRCHFLVSQHYCLCIPTRRGHGFKIVHRGRLSVLRQNSVYGVSTFRAPKSLPILTSSNIFPEEVFQLQRRYGIEHSSREDPQKIYGALLPHYFSSMCVTAAGIALKEKMEHD